MSVNADLWLRQNFDAHGLYVFALETERAGSTAHSRMFAPELGIVEDPATGSAAGPLGAYLLRYGLVDAPSAAHMVAEQGFEIKRPSLLHIYVEGTAEQITSVHVGGYTQSIGSGVLTVPD